MSQDLTPEQQQFLKEYKATQAKYRATRKARLAQPEVKARYAATRRAYAEAHPEIIEARRAKIAAKRKADRELYRQLLAQSSQEVTS